MARSSQTLWWVRGLTVALSAAMLTVPASASASASASSTCDAGQSRADMASAAVAASACQRPVEDLSRRTETSRTAANPDGTATVTSYLEPRWVKRADRSWVDVDTTLRRSGGVVAPVATTLPVSFSAGGTVPLARLVDGDHELTMTWPAPLPVPTLDGSSALYAEVYPGVDLRLTASAEGFSEVLVVKTREALRDQRLAKVTFGLSTRNLAVVAGTAGQTEARDSRGKVVFSSPAPLMWDSAGGGPGTVRGGATSTELVRVAPRRAVMQRVLSAHSLAVIPVRSIMDDPAVQLPVFIDPAWTGNITGNGWKNVSESSPNSTSYTLVDGAAQGDMGSGRTCDSSNNGNCTSPTYRVRSLLTMDLGGVQGKRILRATFNVTQKWSWTCGTPTNAKLWLTAAFSSGTSWSNQPGWDGSHTAEAPANHRADGAASCAGTGNVEFDTTSMIAFSVANGWAAVTMGFQAKDESTVNQWKRFASNTVSQSIVYNSKPNTPDTFSTAGQAGCVTGSGRPVVTASNQVLSARVTDPDGAGEGDIGGSLRGDFSWQRFDAPTSTWVNVGSASGTPQAAGTTSPAPPPTFPSGVFRWRVQAVNTFTEFGGGTDTSDFGPWCEFEVDAVAPRAPALTPATGNVPFVAGRTVRLTLSPGGSPADTDITGYSWFVVDAGGTHATTFTPGASVSVDWTPVAGQGTVHVRAKDRIQLSGTESTYVFNAAQASTEVARWPLAEPAGSTVVSDVTGHGNNATATLTAPAALGAPGRIVNGATVVSINGAAGNGLTTATPVLDLSRSFTLSAWARLADKTATRVVASQFGNDGSGVSLEYTAGAGEDRWELVMFGTGGAVTGRARSTVVPIAGVWTHLTGAFDSGTGTIRLFVNGVSQSTQAPVVGLNGGGSMRIGRGAAQPFAGSIADVRVWDRVLSTVEILDLSDPTSAENVSTENVGQWLVEPGSCFGAPTTCLDSSAYAHDITLSGDAAVTPAGQSGSGLQYGPHGLAETIDPNTGLPGPPLHTDQSFTVSAWVSLAVLPTGLASHTAIGQRGSRISGFFLGISRGSDGFFHWCASMSGADDPGGGGEWRAACHPTALATANLNTWTHLVIVYDAVFGTLTLYVNGTQAGNRLRTQRWDATGAMTLGAALWHVPPNAPGIEDWWSGGIDTVYAYAGAVPASSINRIP